MCLVLLDDVTVNQCVTVYLYFVDLKRYVDLQEKKKLLSWLKCMIFIIIINQVLTPLESEAVNEIFILRLPPKVLKQYVMKSENRTLDSHCYNIYLFKRHTLNMNL